MCLDYGMVCLFVSKHHNVSQTSSDRAENLFMISDRYLFTPYRSFIEVCKDRVGVSSTVDREGRGPCVSPRVSFRDIILGMLCARPLLVMNKYIICYF